MADSLKIQIQNEKINKKLQQLAETTGNLRPVMRAIAEKMLDSTKENFATEGARLGEHWKQLSPGYRKQRYAKGYTGKMLQVERKLYNSITADSDDTTAMIGTNLIYAKVHQLGFDGKVRVAAHSRKVASRNKYRGKTKTASGIGVVKAHSRHMKVDARPFLGLNDNDIDGILNIITNALNKV